MDELYTVVFTEDGTEEDVSAEEVIQGLIDGTLTLKNPDIDRKKVREWFEETSMEKE